MSSHGSATPPIVRTRDSAFTLIEVLIATVIFAVAAGIVTMALVNGINGSAVARSGSLSDAMIERTSAALRDDVAKAVTPDRAGFRLRDPGDFEDAVRDNAVARSTDPADAGAVLDIDEVVMATPTELRLRADVVSTSVGAECITWRAAVTQQKFTITRFVDPGTACGSGSLGSQVLLRADSRIGGVVTRPFSYEMLCAGCPGSGSGATPCRPWRMADGVPYNQRRWVVGVHAEFVAASVSGDVASSAFEGVTAEIRSRDTFTYRGALGC